jgi:acetyl/propionyl-CoA carboxylase alpha subunit
MFMRKTMKSISILLALMFFVPGVCAVPTAAADVTYSVSPAIGATGETVTVNVSLSTSVNLWGGNVQLKYNPAELQVVSCATGGAAAAGSSVNDSGSSVNFSGMYSAKSGTIFTVTFKILLESGKSALTLSSSENTDVDGATHGYSVSNGSITVLNKVPAEKVTLDKTSVTLKKGDSTKLKATVSPSNATENKVTFYSSDDNVATVSADGTVTAVGVTKGATVESGAFLFSIG